MEAGKEPEVNGFLVKTKWGIKRHKWGCKCFQCHKKRRAHLVSDSLPKHGVNHFFIGPSIKIMALPLEQ